MSFYKTIKINKYIEKSGTYNINLDEQIKQTLLKNLRLYSENENENNIFETIEYCKLIYGKQTIQTIYGFLYPDKSYIIDKNTLEIKYLDNNILPFDLTYSGLPYGSSTIEIEIKFKENMIPSDYIIEFELYNISDNDFINIIENDIIFYDFYKTYTNKKREHLANTGRAIGCIIKAKDNHKLYEIKLDLEKDYGYHDKNIETSQILEPILIDQDKNIYICKFPNKINFGYIRNFKISTKSDNFKISTNSNNENSIDIFMLIGINVLQSAIKFPMAHTYTNIFKANNEIKGIFDNRHLVSYASIFGLKYSDQL